MAILSDLVEGVVSKMDDSQLVPSSGVEEDLFLDADSMEMDEEDHLPLPPQEHPNSCPVMAASAP